MSDLETGFSFLLLIFILESAAFAYFAHWILWRINPKLTMLLTDYHRRTSSEEEEE